MSSVSITKISEPVGTRGSTKHQILRTIRTLSRLIAPQVDFLNGNSQPSPFMNI